MPNKDRSPDDSETREALEGLLAAVRHPPQPMALAEKLSVAELIRKWFVHGIVALMLIGSGLWRCISLSQEVSRLSAIGLSVQDMPERMAKQEKKMRQIRPQFRKMQWQFDQGLTNGALKEKGITPPEFAEED